MEQWSAFTAKHAGRPGPRACYERSGGVDGLVLRFLDGSMEPEEEAHFEYFLLGNISMAHILRIVFRQLRDTAHR